MDDRRLDKALSASALQQTRLINESLPTDEEFSQTLPSEDFERKIRSLIAGAK